MVRNTSWLAQIPGGVWALGLVSLLMDISSEMVHSLLPLFLVSGLGVSVVTLGWIEGLAEATALLVKVFSGMLSDAWGRRKPLALTGYGLGAAAKPWFALADSAGLVLGARLLDRLGKGMRGAPRDALVADLAPSTLRGTAFGLRQALDTVGSVLGPALAVLLMVVLANDYRIVFWLAALPAALSVLVLWLGVREPDHVPGATRPSPISRAALQTLGRAYWRVVVLGAVFTLARFSDAFLILRAHDGGLSLTWAPVVLVAMNLSYAVFALPFGALSDRYAHSRLLALGLMVLIAADLVLATHSRGAGLWFGVALWGLHMAITQGLLATMISQTAPAPLRATAFGLFGVCTGMTLLAASVLAGWLWQVLGPAGVFFSGALISALALILVGWPGPGQPAHT